MRIMKKSLIQLLKNIIKYFYFKYHRVKYFICYGIPIFDKRMGSDNIVDFLDWVGPIESAAIIGKGASIYESSPKELIQNCDFKCILNSVDVEHLESYIGSKIDAQMTTQVGSVNSLMPVLSKKLINQFGVKALICNSTKTYNDGRVVNTYLNFFNDRADFISCMAENTELKFDVDLKKYGGRGLTMASNLVRMLYNIKTLKRIVFAGVDAYHYPYSYRGGVKNNDKVFYQINAGSDNPKISHGLPFLAFLFDTLEIINRERVLHAYFPAVLRSVIDFPDVKYIKFYS
jgi:hypothetical protein